MIQIYNTLSRRKDPLAPIVPGQVGMYVCGPTVYDYCHVGHARVFVVFDVVARYLRHRGYSVRYVRNITDIDDKIIRRAVEQQVSTGELTQRYITAMHEDLQRLAVLPPDAEPRASEHITGIVRMIQTLIAGGHAYAAPNGDVYYTVQSFTTYGQLAQRDLTELRAGARVEINEAKHDPLDFALWKTAKPDEPAWESPWGLGRPGWHIECSAMSTSCLGPHFDIHGGGADLVFPHHENEIAQSEAATGKPYVNIWMHNGFVRVAEEKMSKSLGNFFTIRDVLTQHHPQSLRYLLLSAHYRSPLDYGPDHLRSAREALTRAYLALSKVPACAPGVTVAPDAAVAAAFYAAMDDDFNTPAALGVLFEAVRALNSSDDLPRRQALAHTLRALGGVLGILGDDPELFLRGTADVGLPDEAIDALVAARDAARAARDYARADALRRQLEESGLILEDGAGKSRWRRA